MNKTTTLLLKFSSGTLISTSSRNVCKLLNVLPFITARNEVGARLCFYTCLWFCSRGGIPACIAGGIPVCIAGLWGGGIRACLAGLQAHTQVGSWGVWPGGSPGPHLGGSPGTDPGARVSQHALRQTPPCRQLLLRAVRILLECILVYNTFS